VGRSTKKKNIIDYAVRSKSRGAVYLPLANDLLVWALYAYTLHSGPAESAAAAAKLLSPVCVQAVQWCPSFGSLGTHDRRTRCVREIWSPQGGGKHTSKRKGEGGRMSGICVRQDRRTGGEENSAVHAHLALTCMPPLGMIIAAYP
jgi:hypothetical protein